MKRSTYFAICAIIPFFLASCAVYKKGEDVILKDATPPAGYAPSFITTTKTFNADELVKPELTVSYIDNKPFETSSKVYLHLIDNKNTYITGAAGKSNLKYWCNVYLTYEGKREPVKFKLNELVDGAGRKNAIAIVMDHSGSMGEDRAIAVQKAVANLIDSKRNDDAMALIRYDHRIKTEVPLTNSKQQLATYHLINGLKGYNGFTAIVDASNQAISEIEGKGYDNNAVIVFTDGWDNSSKLSPDSLINYSILKNTKVLGVDFGDNINPDFIKNISEKTGGYYRRIYNRNEFDLLFKDMYYRLNNAYTLEFDTDFYGKHFLEVEFCLPSGTLIASSSFDNTPDVGQISLVQVNFDFNKSTIKSESKKATNKLLKLMKSMQNIEVELRGHTDSLNKTGDPNYNTKLSQDRADAVKNELIKGGINAARIRSIGFGDQKPIADNQSDEGRSKNRRTEFIIIKK